jgi:cytochrome c oxidase subunit 2
MIGMLALSSSVSGEYNHFFWLLTAICGTVGTGIAAFLIFCAWRYRRRDPNELPPQIKNYIPAEIAWIGIPTLIFIAMFFYGVKLYFDMERPPDNAQVVYVVAKQWMWKLQHIDGAREINELHVPVGQSIELRMISQDVIHSFYVPDFRIKQDVLPGRYTSIWFRATRPGAYHLFCAEYCGTNHSQMHGWVYVLSPSEYNRWVQQGGAEGSLADTGEKLFHQFACANCHHYSGHGPAPNLAGLYHSAVQLQGGGLGMADDEYIRKSILQPNAQVTYGFHQSIMPTYQGQLTEDQVIALIAYIKALGARPIRTAGAASGQEGGAGPANSAAEPTSPSEPAPQPIETNKPGGR